MLTGQYYLYLLVSPAGIEPALFALEERRFIR